MIIKVLLDGGKLSISPDPASVRIRDLVVWVLLYKGQIQGRLLWEVYFGQATPFPNGRSYFTLETNETPPHDVGTDSGITHDGVIGPESPVAVGDYKYGVRVVNPATKTVQGDDDPWLQVRL